MGGSVESLCLERRQGKEGMKEERMCDSNRSQIMIESDVTCGYRSDQQHSLKRSRSQDKSETRKNWRFESSNDSKKRICNESSQQITAIQRNVYYIPIKLSGESTVQASINVDDFLQTVEDIWGDSDSE
mmetsp:Transcript_13073/g.23517  ORF Transcript_13073/g.23517 Transcript_13073/m.23517 type:complete len:129 (-) Transcript_13073:617-1003(-)